MLDGSDGLKNLDQFDQAPDVTMSNWPIFLVLLATKPRKLRRLGVGRFQEERTMNASSQKSRLKSRHPNAFASVRDRPIKATCLASSRNTDRRQLLLPIRSPRI